MPRPSTKTLRNRLIGAGVLVILVIAMVLNTKFLTPAEVAAIAPKPFDPAATAAELYTKANQELPAKAKPLGEVVLATQTNLKSAAEKYGAVAPSDGAYVFPVTTTATVVAATDAALELQVEGVPSETKIVVPLTTAVNGTVVRDVMGFKFADAPGQTDYQYVGDELKKLMLNDINDAVADPATLKGKKVTLLGAVGVQALGAAVPRAKPVNVQPISLKVG